MPFGQSFKISINCDMLVLPKDLGFKSHPIKNLFHQMGKDIWPWEGTFIQTCWKPQKSPALIQYCFSSVLA